MAKKKPTKDAADADEAIDFESALADVETIVHELESGDADLTRSLAQYEIGIQRLKQCHDLLQKAERRITLLSGFDADGNPVSEPFESDDTPPTVAKRKSRSASRGDSGDQQGATKSRRRQSKGKEPASGTDVDAETDSDDSSVDDSLGLF